MRMMHVLPDHRRDRRALVASLVGAALFVGTLSSASGESSDPDASNDSNQSSPDTRSPNHASRADRDVPPPYPADRNSIRFSHATHADTACATCHGDARTSPSSSDDLRPDMEICADCHRQEHEPTLERCSGCHTGYDIEVEGPIRTPEDWKSVRPAPMVPEPPAPRLRFDHRQHLEHLDGSTSDERGAACRRCHARGAEGAPEMPSMESCLDCHRSGAEKAPSGTCSTCHPGSERPEGRADGDAANPPDMFTFGGTGELWDEATEPDDSSAMAPPDHDDDWLQRHGVAARVRSSTCEECHTEQDCNDCHDGTVASSNSVHPPNYDVLHASDARTRRDDCTDCHTIETFCTQCHARAEVTPGSRDPPPRSGNYHPPGWVQSEGSNNHAVMARRRITDCASCHTEQDCVSCHQGVNPHPPEFQLNCGRLLKANPRTCLECHQSRSRLEGMCR